MSHAIDESCTGCHACCKPCPTEAIVGEAKKLHYIIQDKCIQCGACYQVCRHNSIKRVKRGAGDAVQRRARELWRPPAKPEPAAVA
ncbi:MAG: 4Fe-4S binding protein [Candidatus Zixiibacteriota bacterium]